MTFAQVTAEDIEKARVEMVEEGYSPSTEDCLAWLLDDPDEVHAVIESRHSFGCIDCGFKDCQCGR